MTAIEALFTKHAVPTYFALTFAISWSGVLFVVGGPAGMSGVRAQDNPVFPFALLAMVAGPALAGILSTCLAHGFAGLRELVSRVLRSQVGGRWYAVALFAAPALAIAAGVALLPFSAEFVPGIAIADDRSAVLLLALAVALTAGLFEELGWTGFAIPELRRRYGVITTGLIVGIIWSAWHVLVVVWGIGNRAGSIPLAVFVVLDGLTALVAFRVLMVWVYDRTGSLLVAMLMHVGLTASTIALWPVTTGARLIAYGGAFAAATWIVIAVIALVSSGQFRQSSLRRRVA